MKRIGVAALIAGWSTAAGAATIWQKVETGMTRQQVEGLYPAGGEVTYKPKLINID